MIPAVAVRSVGSVDEKGSRSGRASTPPPMLRKTRLGACVRRATSIARRGRIEPTPLNTTSPSWSRRAMATAIISGAATTGLSDTGIAQMLIGAIEVRLESVCLRGCVEIVPHALFIDFVVRVTACGPSAVGCVDDGGDEEVRDA